VLSASLLVNETCLLVNEIDVNEIDDDDDDAAAKAAIIAEADAFAESDVDALMFEAQARQLIDNLDQVAFIMDQSERERAADVID